jgi:hypothetical protein
MDDMRPRNAGGQQTIGEAFADFAGTLGLDMVGGLAVSIFRKVWYDADERKAPTLDEEVAEVRRTQKRVEVDRSVREARERRTRASEIELYVDVEEPSVAS